MVNSSMQKIMIEDSHKITCDLTLAIEETIGDDIASVHYNNTDHIEEAHLSQKHRSKNEMIIKKCAINNFTKDENNIKSKNKCNEEEKTSKFQVI